MNLAFFSRFSKTRKTNATFKIIDHIRKHPVFKGARIDLYVPSINPQKLIVLLGQIHTVWKGKIGNRERKKIVRCQARLCSYYAYFEQFHNVTKFGGEGIYDGLETSFHDKMNFQLYEEVEKKIKIEKPIRLEQLATVARKILEELGLEWHQELRSQRDIKKIQRYASAVSGQSLFNFLNEEKVKVYPIEGERDYQQVLQGITQLGNRVAKLEQSYEMKVVKQRGGKALNEKEAEVVKQYNSLVKQFNKLIGSDIRERSTMEILKKKVEKESLLVFTMGMGHRKNYLKLTREYLSGTDVAFMFISPPELLINWWITAGVPLLILLILLVLGYWF